MPVTVSANADTEVQRIAITDSLRRELAKVHTSAESIPLLYDIFDLSDLSTRMENARALFVAAQNAGDVGVQLDALRHLAAHAGSASNEALAREVLEKVRHLPPSEEQKQTLVFARASLAGAYRFKSEDERSRYLLHVLKDFTESEEHLDRYERATRLFIIIQALSGQTKGALLAEYISQLDKLLKEMPRLSTDFLDSKLQSTAAYVYQLNDEPTLSINADRRLMEIMDNLEEYYRTQKRQYRRYDVQRYISLRRMLRNYEVLSNEEVDSFYAQARVLAERNPEIKDDFERKPSIRAAYLLNHGSYAEALPLVRQLADSAKKLDERCYYVRQLIKVAEQIGDEDLRIRTEAENSRLLQEFMEFKSGQRMRELQVLYDVASLRQMTAQDELEREVRRSRVLKIICGVIGLLTVVAVGFIIRFRLLLRRAREKNQALRNDRAQLIVVQTRLKEAAESARETASEKMRQLDEIVTQSADPISDIAQYNQMIIDNTRNPELDYVHKFAVQIKAQVKNLLMLINKYKA